MKALSVRQPWAWAIVHGPKRIENRERQDGRMPAMCRHRGPLLIHASKGYARGAFDDDVESILDLRVVARDLVRSVAEMNVALRGMRHGEGTWIPREEMRFGGIVGACNVVAHVDPSGVVRRVDGTQSAIEVDARWHRRGSYGLVLADVRPLPFLPFKGALGLFEVPDALAAKALAETASLRGGQ